MTWRLIKRRIMADACRNSCTVFAVLQLLLVTVLGHSALTPNVCLGTGEYRGSEATSVVLNAISLGYRCVDTAHGLTVAV